MRSKDNLTTSSPGSILRAFRALPLYQMLRCLLFIFSLYISFGFILYCISYVSGIGFCYIYYMILYLFIIYVVFNAYNSYVLPFL